MKIVGTEWSVGLLFCSTRYKQLTRRQGSGVLHDSLISVKAVEYASHTFYASKAMLIPLDKTNVSVKVYQNIPYEPEYMYSATDQDDPAGQNAKIYAESVQLPSDRFDGIWDRLEFISPNFQTS